MKKTDTSEKGLETTIVGSLIKDAGYIQDNSEDFDRKKLSSFLSETEKKGK